MHVAKFIVIVCLASCDADAPSATLQDAKRAGVKAANALSLPPAAYPAPSDSHAVRLSDGDGASPRGFGERLAAAAFKRTLGYVRYDASYVGIDYPMGDVADNRGVCADVLVRAYRGVGVDLQQRVHEDMGAAFAAYPRIWGLSRPDSNIDHRRVPNLETFLARQGAELPATQEGGDYLPGDVVTYRLDGSWLPHVAVVSDRIGAGGEPMIVHNIGAGTRLEDALFEWPPHRHFRWRPDDLPEDQFSDDADPGRAP